MLFRALTQRGALLSPPFTAQMLKSCLMVLLTTDNRPSHLTSPQCMLGKGPALVMTLSGVSSLEVR